ncbi:MAG TPA: DUF1223 domain-containing protein [Kofleriaceae bacterium]
MRRLALFSLLFACTTANGETPKMERDGFTSSRGVDEAPLVVELFTSQGCSSCPPADKLLDNLARDGALAGRPLAPLSFHVDYWDDLGWPDPFALPAWTERQSEYARALGDRSVYTPELVVGGRVGLVGSNASRAAQAIASAPRQIKIAATAKWTKDSVTIEAKAPDGADVIVAIWQDGTKTKVPRGENAGTTLTNDRVVRRLERVAVAGKPGAKTIKIDPSWGAVGAVAFAQKSDRSIVGAALLPR